MRPLLSYLKTPLLAGVFALGFSGYLTAEEGVAKRPNFLFVVSDDQSYINTGITGDPQARTPNFDRVAREGILFTNAYASSPSCSPSRGAILTGRNQWELKESSVISCGFPGDLVVYQDLLWDAGYYIGYTGKGWGPGLWVPYGRKTNPAGIDYSKLRSPRDATDFRKVDYAANFELFLKDKNPGQPFSFWFSAYEPHRPYVEGSGEKAGFDPAKVFVPPSMYDNKGMRSDICDYLAAIESYDQQLGLLLDVLEKAGELDNTIVFVTSDNGMAFPAGKSNLYDLGTHEPLAVMWKKHIPGGLKVDDLVSLADVAPTILELAGVTVPKVMTARSFANILKEKKSGIVDPSRKFVVTGLDVHDTPYPMRAIRTQDYLYIMNVEPERYKWPRENSYIWGQKELPPDKKSEFSHLAYPAFYGAFREDPEVKPYVDRAFGQRPAEELYDVKKDPYQLHNLAAQPDLAATKDALKADLIAYLKKTGDPRFTGGPVVFNDYKPVTKEFREAHNDEIRAAARETQAVYQSMKAENRKRAVNP